LYDHLDIQKTDKKYKYLENQIQALISFASLLALGDRTIASCLGEVRRSYGTTNRSSFWQTKKLSPFLEKELKDVCDQIKVEQTLKMS